VVLCEQGRHDEAESALRFALASFKSRQEWAEVARTRLAQASALRARPSSQRPLVLQELLEVLAVAEECRRASLVREIEEDLRAEDATASCRHACARVRGRSIRADPSSLVSGSRETARVMFLDLKGYTEYARDTDPEVVMLTLNELMTDLGVILQRYQIHANQYLGDGFMALVRDKDHAVRALSAALELRVTLEEFNRPRKVLGLRSFEARVGVNTGEVFLGNVGTYHKMDYTAIGITTNLAARLQSEAEPGLPCISAATYEEVRERFLFKTDNPRTVSPQGDRALEGHAGWPE
jgi:class 3 adenylate cyclase